MDLVVNLIANPAKVAMSAILFYAGSVSVTITLIINSALNGEEHDFLVNPAVH